MGKVREFSMEPLELVDLSIVLLEGDICPLCNEKVNWGDWADGEVGHCGCYVKGAWVDGRMDTSAGPGLYEQHPGKVVMFRYLCRCPDSKCNCRDFAGDNSHDVTDGAICDVCATNLYDCAEEFIVCGKRTKGGTECPGCHTKIAKKGITICKCGVSWDPEDREIDMDIFALMDKAGL